MPNNRLHQPHVPLPEIHWSPNEQWVWRKLRQGESADFNERYGVCPIPWEKGAWNEEEKARRLIRPEFLYTVLLYEPWRSALSNWGFQLDGAYFVEPIMMPHAEVSHEFWLAGCRLEDGLYLYNARFARRLVLEGCLVLNTVGFQNLYVGRKIVLDDSCLSEVDFKYVYAGGGFSAHRTLFASTLQMDGAIIRNNLSMHESFFKGDTKLPGVRVKGQLGLARSFFSGELILDQAVVDNGLFMQEGCFKKEISIRGARVEGIVDLNDARFEEKMVIQRSEIKGEIFARKAGFADEAAASIIFSKIGGNLQLESAKFHSLDLTGTHAQAVVDNGMEWPDKLKLDHFTCQHLGGLGEGYGGDHMLDRPASWFVGWLAKHKPYSPQPYEQCAKVLREAGQPGKAKEILYQAKERERNEPNGDFRRWVWLTASKWLLGHGLTWRFAVVPAAWAVGVLLLGWLIFCQTTTLMETHSPRWGLGYSLSRLIPLVSFGKDLSELGVSSFAARAWFTFQTLFGWFLASLIVAGLAGVGRLGRKS